MDANTNMPDVSGNAHFVYVRNDVLLDGKYYVYNRDCVGSGPLSFFETEITYLIGAGNVTTANLKNDCLLCSPIVTKKPLFLSLASPLLFRHALVPSNGDTSFQTMFFGHRTMDESRFGQKACTLIKAMILY